MDISADVSADITANMLADTSTDMSADVSADKYPDISAHISADGFCTRLPYGGPLYMSYVAHGHMYLWYVPVCCLFTEEELGSPPATAV